MSVLDWLAQFGPLKNIKTQEEKEIKDLPFRYIGLYFTATWCSYCVKIADKMPQLLATVNQKGSLFRLLTCRLDEDDSSFGFYDLKFKSLSHQAASDIASWLQIQHIPAIVVYDYLGRLVTRNAYAEMAKYQEKTIEMWDRKMELL